MLAKLPCGRRGPMDAHPEGGAVGGVAIQHDSTVARAERDGMADGQVADLSLLSRRRSERDKIYSAIDIQATEFGSDIVCLRQNSLNTLGRHPER
jgi:hypothetical protein